MGYQLDDCIENTILNNVITNSGQYGIILTKSHNNIISDNMIVNATNYSIELLGSQYNEISDNYLLNPSYLTNNFGSGILLYTEGGVHSIHNKIESNFIISNIANRMKYGITETDANQNYNMIINNKIVNYATAGATIFGANTIVRGNTGYVTENSGTTTILNTTFAIVINHGLSYTPTTANTAWSITPLELSTNDPGQFYIDTFTATQATIHCRNDPGASNLDLKWSAWRTP